MRDCQISAALTLAAGRMLCASPLPSGSSAGAGLHGASGVLPLGSLRIAPLLPSSEGRMFNQLACQHEGAPLTLQCFRTKATLVARSDFLLTCVQHCAKFPRALSNFACTALEKASSSLP